MKESNFPEQILKSRVSIDEPYNAFRNPILNRRLRNSISPTTA
jgi:hypothetical protein